MFLVEISTAVSIQLPLLLPVKKILHLGLRWDGPSLQPPILGGGRWEGEGGGGRPRIGRNRSVGNRNVAQGSGRSKISGGGGGIGKGNGDEI